jgi:Rrf2 family protein
MNFTKTTEYAIRILSFMALRDELVFTAESLAENLHIPKKYLQRLLTDLSKAGFIKSMRGRTGGFEFSRTIDSIYLSEIIEFTEGDKWQPKCLFGFENCVLDSPCIMHDIWAGNHLEQVRILKSTSLGNIRQNYRKQP